MAGSASKSFRYSSIAHAARTGFVLQEPGLALDTAAITTERAIGSDHAMAGHNNCNGICSISQTNSPDGRRSANLLGKFFVRDGRTAGDMSQSAPQFPLKRRAGCLHWQSIYRRHHARAFPRLGWAHRIK
jgi:hypothetical protein